MLRRAVQPRVRMRSGYLLRRNSNHSCLATIYSTSQTVSSRQKRLKPAVVDMGGKSSRPSSSTATKKNGEGQNTLRAISRGRVYVIISFPASVQRLENCRFNETGYDELLGDLQESMPDFEFFLECGMIQRYSKHATFYNSAHPNKGDFRPRVRVEVFYTGVYEGVDGRLVRKLVCQHLDPDSHTSIDIRCEMGRYHTTSHLETLLRL